MADIVEVDTFLNNYKTLYSLTNAIYYPERKKTDEDLAELGLTALQRRDIILDLNPEDYSKGPEADKKYPEHNIFVFGAASPLNGEEIYIKISSRREVGQPVCISFHKAKHKIHYPFK